MMKHLFNLLLIVAVIILTALCVKSILTPIKFEKEKEIRDRAVQSRLIAIRTAQVEFKNQTGRYTAHLDTLIAFVKEGRIAEIVKEGTLTDEQLKKGITEAIAVKRGIIKRDTSYVSVKEKLFGDSFDADAMKFIPFSHVPFEMAVSQIQTASGIKVKVFECKAPYKIYLKGLDRQLVVNAIDHAKKLEKYPGMKVGSITEINNNAGNWE